MQLNFPANFYWGAASSATQSEGNFAKKAPNLWDYWYEIEPTRFHNRIGPQQTSTFYHNYRQDIGLMKEYGLNSFRTSISWARLMPNGELDQEAVDFYHKIIDEMIAQGITPFMNLYHFDMPMYYQDMGGFANREVVAAYANYAETAFKLFAAKIPYWFTFNEPIVPVFAGYIDDFHYPNILDTKIAMQVMHNTNLASALAIEKFHQLGCNGKIGIILNLSPHYPRSQHPADLAAAKVAEFFYNQSFLDPSVLGHYPAEFLELMRQHDILPEITEADLRTLQNNTVDILGVNYYHPQRIKAKEYQVNPQAPFKPQSLFDHYDMPGKQINPYRGWEIYAPGMFDLAEKVRTQYGNIPFFISENGMGVEGESRFLENNFINDQYRIDFYTEHMQQLHRSIQNGANCFGYHVWTFIDNWSWTNAYKNRYGLIGLNVDTQERIIKASAHWFNQLATSNSLSIKD